MSHKINNQTDGKTETLKRINSKLAQLRGAVQGPKGKGSGGAAENAVIRPIPQGQASGGGKLVGLVTQTGKEVRAPPSGGRSRASSSTLNRPAAFPKSMANIPRSTVEIRNSAGVVVGSVPHLYHTNVESVGLAAAHTLREGGVSEHETIDGKRGRMVRAVGRVYLDSIESVSAHNPALGDLLGLYPIAPSAFGERLEMLSDMFEQNKVNRLAVTYHPTVPATEPGALGMFARNDTTAPLYVTGGDLLRHAATHPSFKETQVWERCEMEVNPSDVMKKYFDAASGETRMSLQGEIQIFATSGLTQGISYGNLYLVYDIEFFSEELDFDEAEVPQGIATLAFNAATWAAGTYLQARVGPTSGPGLPNITLTLDGAGIDSAAYVMYGVVGGDPGTLTSIATAEGEGIQTLKPGVGFVALFSDTDGTWDTGTWTPICNFAWSFDEADLGNVWTLADAQVAPVTYTYPLKYRAFKKIV